MFKISEVTTSTSSYTYLVTKIRVNPPRHIFFFHLFTLPLHPSFFLLKLAGGLFQKKKLAGGLLMVSLPRCKHHHLSITGKSHVKNSHCNMVTGLGHRIFGWGIGRPRPKHYRKIFRECTSKFAPTKRKENFPSNGVILPGHFPNRLPACRCFSAALVRSGIQDHTHRPFPPFSSSYYNDVISRLPLSSLD